jgi:hypothetical protein
MKKYILKNFFFVYVALGFELRASHSTWATLPALFVMGILEIGSLMNPLPRTGFKLWSS